MNINDLVGRAPAVVISPSDVVAITIDRYLSGQQITEIQSYWQKRLPNNEIIIFQKSMTIEVSKVEELEPPKLEPLAIPKISL